MPKIFISYRREDSAYPAAVTRSRLVSDFGEGEIFFDVDSIPPGHDFRVHIGQNVGASDYVIVVIGKPYREPPCCAATIGAGRRAVLCKRRQDHWSNQQR